MFYFLHNQVKESTEGIVDVLTLLYLFNVISQGIQLNVSKKWECPRGAVFAHHQTHKSFQGLPTLCKSCTRR